MNSVRAGIVSSQLRRVSPIQYKPLGVLAGYRNYSTASTTVQEHKSKVHGSYHWTLERSMSFATLPLFASAIALGPVPVVDFLLGIVVPIHCHLGFDAMITDYYPKRSSPVMNGVLSWTLRLSTLLALYGCYQFNTNDVGLTALVGRVWTAKNTAEKKE